MNNVKLRERVIFRSWGATQDEIGGTVADETSAHTLWAQVEDRRGLSQNPFQQSVWTYDYRVTVRYETARQIGSNFTIDYDSKRMRINSLSIQNEGYRRWYVLLCTAVDDQTGSGGGGSVPALPQVMFYNYEATAITDTFTYSGIVGKTVFAAFKDGINFQIVTTVPVGKEVRVVSGVTTWGISFEIGETATLLYL